ncbi:hypothetical protein [Fictibacillus phosphorivorans]|nr:hypothetical protein [Fictibacillus phosphorivorans]
MKLLLSYYAILEVVNYFMTGKMLKIKGVTYYSILERYRRKEWM